MRLKAILPAALLVMAAEMIPAHAGVQSMSASAILTKIPVLQVATKKKSARRSEVDRSIDRGTVPSRYRRNVPREYQRYIPFESDKRVY